MPAPTVRDFKTRVFESAGYCPLASTAVTFLSKPVTTALVVQLLLSNTDVVDRLVTIKDASDNVMFNNTISSGNLYFVEIPQGWRFEGGIKINAAAASVVRYELLGYQLPS